jgi:hypothetical protein
MEDLGKSELEEAHLIPCHIWLSETSSCGLNRCKGDSETFKNLPAILNVHFSFCSPTYQFTPQIIFIPKKGTFPKLCLLWGWDIRNTMIMIHQRSKISSPKYYSSYKSS